MVDMTDGGSDAKSSPGWRMTVLLKTVLTGLGVRGPRSEWYVGYLTDSLDTMVAWLLQEELLDLESNPSEEVTGVTVTVVAADSFRGLLRTNGYPSPPF
jgi:hypothetical protein